jgi:exodeoxyribonuclease VII small subunit
MEKTINYDEALKRIEEILAILDEGNTGMEEITQLVQEATTLIAACKSKLKNINEEILKGFEDPSNK